MTAHNFNAFNLNNEEERLILNKFHYNRLLVKYQTEFEERKENFEENYYMRGLDDADRLDILTKEKTFAKEQRENRKTPKKLIIWFGENDPYKYANAYSSYYERIGRQEKFNFSIEPIYENGEIHTYFDAYFDIEYIEFIKNYKPQVLSETSKIKTVEEEKGREVILSLREIALFHYYTKTHITVNNANDKAKLYGQNSGQKLMKHYKEIKENALNITEPKTAKENIKKVITLLNNDPQAKEKAEKDLKVAETKNK